MNFPTWLPFFKRNEDDNADPREERTDKNQPGIGSVTGRRLDDLDCLCRPFVTDPFFRLRPPFSRKAAALSLELAYMAYSLELEPWRQAGWNDFSIQIDNTLQSGMTHSENASGERMQSIINSWKLYRAKAALTELNPVSQLMSTLRQRESSDTVKAVCMMHPQGDGHYLLAIGFMGTGKRLYDWISNLRFTTEEGFHKGFFQLCSHFEKGAETIVFPSTAQALGLEKLTLGEVLSEMRRGGSRFRLWMAGHSQGGAVMQVFTHRLLSQWGLLPQNIVGYGFASPTVSTGKLIYDPASYPLYHIINSDDVVPRIGSLLHLGLCMYYPANEALRDKTYRLSALPADKEVYQALAPYSAAMADIESIMRYGAAFAQALGEEKGEENLNVLIDKRWTPAFLDKAILYAGDKVMDLLDAILRQINIGYEDLTGKGMNRDELRRLCDRMRPLVHDIPFRRLMTGVASYVLPPHRIVVAGEEGAYAYIVNHDLDALQPFIWVKRKDALPIQRFATVEAHELRGTATALPAAKRRSTIPSSRRSARKGVRRIGYNARRER